MSSVPQLCMQLPGSCKAQLQQHELSGSVVLQNVNAVEDFQNFHVAVGQPVAPSIGICVRDSRHFSSRQPGKPGGEKNWGHVAQTFPWNTSK